MKKILIAVTLLGLSSAAFADPGGEELKGRCENVKNGHISSFVSELSGFPLNDGAKSNMAPVVEYLKDPSRSNDEIKAVCSAAQSGSSTDIIAAIPKTPTNPGGGNSGSTGNVSESDFEADQERQDKETAAADQKIVDDQKKVDEAQNTEIGKKADQSALDQEVTDRTEGDKNLSDKIDQNQQDQAVTDGKQNQDIKDLDKNKVDKSEQTVIDNAQNVEIGKKADQSALDQEVTDRTNGDKDLSDKIQKNKDDQAVTDNGQNVRMDGIEKQAGILDTRVGKTEVRLDNAEGAIRETNDQLAVTDKRSQNNAVRLDGVETKNTEQDKLISQKVDTSTFKDDQARQDAVIATKASKKELANETASRKSADAKLSSRIDSNDATLVQHDQRITSNTQRIGSVEGRVSNLEQSTNKRFSDVDKRIGDNRKVASAGIAGAGAMANIPGLTKNGDFSVGAGIGGYDGEQAVAVGFNARISENVTTKVTVSTNTQSEVLWGAGVGVEW